MPLTAEMLADNIGTDWRKEPEEVNELVMERIALLVPPNARGEYSDVTGE